MIVFTIFIALYTFALTINCLVLRHGTSFNKFSNSLIRYRHNVYSSPNSHGNAYERSYLHMSSSSKKIKTNSNSRNNKRNRDSWKVLTSKFDAMKEEKEKFGKIDKQHNENSGPDLLQCRHYAICSGCTNSNNFQDIAVAKRATRFFQTVNKKLAIHIGNITEWRTHVKLAVQPMSKWGGLRFGLYKSGTHSVEPIPDCKVHHPRINYAVEQLRLAAVDAGVKGYIKGTGGINAQGELRYIQLSMDRSTKKIQLVLVWNALEYKEASQSLPRLVKRLKARPDIWHSVTINFQTSTSNAIFSYSPKAWKTLWGPPLLKERVGDCDFFFQPQIFRQANLDEFENSIIPLVIKNIPEGSSVAELYAGIGLIGLNAAKRSQEVICSDSNPYIDSVFDKCAESLPADSKEKVFFECFDAEEAVLRGQCDEADVLIVDPPRKGLDAGVLQLLTGNHPNGIEAKGLKRLIYISCGYEALERDLKILLANDQWEVVSADGFILFPGSDHMETVVVLDKCK